MRLRVEVGEALEVGDDQLRGIEPGQADAANPVLRHPARALAGVRHERAPDIDLALLERELETPDLLDVGQELAEVREGAPGGRHLDLMAPAQQVLGDDE